MEKYLELYLKTRKRLKAFQYAKWLIEWDQETIAPKDASAYRSEQVGVLTEEMYTISADPKYIEAIEYLHDHRTQLDMDLQAEIKKQYKELRIIKCVPKQEYIDYQILLSQSAQIWSEAKQKNDFEMFAPTLEKIIVFNRTINS